MNHRNRFAASLAGCVLLACLGAQVVWPQTDAPSAALFETGQLTNLHDLLRTSLQALEQLQAIENTLGQDLTNSRELFRINLELQERLQSTRLALEQNQKEAEAGAARNAEIARNAEAVSARLNLLEQNLADRQARQLDATQSSNRSMLVATAGFATVALAVILLTAYFQWRVVSRLAETSTALSAQMLGRSDAVAALSAGQTSLVPVGRAEQSNARLLGAIDGLGRRISQLEHAATTDRPLTETTVPGPGADTAATPPAEGGQCAPGAQPASSETGSDVALWLGKGQSLLNLDQPESAMACFDEALQSDPNNAEALIKKGMALERLEKLDDAMACYDRAIAGGRSMVVAYLRKGGLYNRLARPAEALECYEQALRTQEKNHAT